MQCINALLYNLWFSAIQEMEKEVEDHRIELDIAQRRRERESGTKKRNHEKSTGDCGQFLFKKDLPLLPSELFIGLFHPPLVMSNLRLAICFGHRLCVYVNRESCDLRRSSLLMALRELGYWQGAD